MTAHKLSSPCKSCDWKGDRNRESCLYCQKKYDYLHIVCGAPKTDTAALYAKHQSELFLITPGRTLDFSGPGPKARTFNCPICGVEVQTSHRAQATCNTGPCPKAYEKLADAARRDRNRARNNERERQRKRLKRMAGGIA